MGVTIIKFFSSFWVFSFLKASLSQVNLIEKIESVMNSLSGQKVMHVVEENPQLTAPVPTRHSSSPMKSSWELLSLKGLKLH